MSELLKVARDVRASLVDAPNQFLTELSTQHHQEKTKSPQSDDNISSSFKPNAPSQAAVWDASIASDIAPEEILEALRSEPDVACLSLVLSRLHRDSKQVRGFSICAPGPIQAQIINVLVNATLPTFWSALDPPDAASLVTCLRCVAGIQALVARLKQSLQSNAKLHGANEEDHLDSILSALNRVLNGEDVILHLWTDITRTHISDIKRELLWKELINVVGSGKIIAAAAQAEDRLKVNEKSNPSSWLSKGSEYAAWLGRNIVSLICFVDMEKGPGTCSFKPAAQLLSKAISLGYPLPLMGAIAAWFLDHVLDCDARSGQIEGVFEQLTASSRRLVWEHTLRWLSSISPETKINEEQLLKTSVETSGIAALVSTMAGKTSASLSMLSSIMSNPSVSSSLSLTVRRAVIAVISQHTPDELEPLLDRSITQFGNRLFIDHVPIVQQESLAQVMLLVAGYLHRRTPMAVVMSARSSGHMQGVTSRLDSSNQRSRWLGMVSGVALSSLVDKPGSQMSFGTDDMDSEEARWYMRLVQVADNIGSLEQLRTYLQSRTVINRPGRKTAIPGKTQEMPIINGKRAFGPPRPPVPAQTKIVGDRATEVFDGSGDDEGTNLQPYAKPDSDPEDSDEDATLVNRNKSRAPVYIRDLMRMLRDEKDHIRFQLGIKHAASLIRRKAGFGNEVKDHAEELATMLCNLQDPFDTEDFDELRLRALIAVLLVDVSTLAPWLSKRAFSGDYSLSQRCVILSALGLGGRELAGFKEDYKLNPDLLEGRKAFPTKRLPSHLHAIYSPDDTSVRRLEAASKQAEHQLIKPLALSAADESTSHLNAVKVRTFSSRLDVERVRRKPAANELAKIFTEAFFSPLVTRYQQEMAAYGAGSVFASAPFVLVTFVKTIALLLHASGPATLSLPEITIVFWDLLLSLRMQAASDISVLDAVLFALLTLLEVSGGDKQRLARETPRQLMETQQWVELVFEKLGGGEMETGGSDEETRVRTLAAGVLIRTREVVDAYQKLLIGNVPGLW